MMNKILLSILVSCATSFAQFYYTPTAQESDNPLNADKASSVEQESCTADLAELSLQKRTLAKKFGECADKKGEYSVSILFFKVAEGESGIEEEAQCFREYMDILKPLATCVKTNHSNLSLFSIDERNSYLYYWASKMNEPMAFNELMEYMLHYKQINEKEAGLQILDQFNTFDEELSLRNVSLEFMEKKIAEANGSREDKDMLRLYFKYLKAKYDWRFRCEIKPAFKCDTTWLGEEKNAFLKKYPESDYQE